MYESIKDENNHQGMNLSLYYTRLLKIKNSERENELTAEDMKLLSEIETALHVLSES